MPRPPALPPLQILWLPTSEGPVPYFPRIAVQIFPPDLWIAAALTFLPRI